MRVSGSGQFCVSFYSVDGVTQPVSTGKRLQLTQRQGVRRLKGLGIDSFFLLVLILQ